MAIDVVIRFEPIGEGRGVAWAAVRAAHSLEGLGHVFTGRERGYDGAPRLEENR